MALSATTIASLMTRLARTDPQTHAILELMLEGLEEVYTEVFPPSQVSARVVTTPTGASTLIPPTDFAYTILASIGIQFNWTAPTSLAIEYEVRKGSAWDTADFVTRTPSHQIIIDPIATGTHRYLIKSINSDGEYSTEFSYVDVVVASPGAVTLLPTVIDNNVLLYWSVPSSTFLIDHYKIYRDGAAFGTKDGTFTIIFESISATHSYGVSAVDIAGNEGPTITIDAEVRQPPDYVFKGQQNLTFNGTLTNCLKENDALLACVDTVIDWNHHFLDNGWADIDDQLAAGYSRYAEPALTTGSYEEKIDFGSIISSALATVIYSTEQVIGNAGAVAITVKMSSSDDDISYTPFVAGTSYFATSLRYLKVKFEFAGAVNNLFKIYSAKITLSAKEEVDGGMVSALAADVGGTVVNFTKDFKDVDTITVTPKTTTEKKAIVDFTDVPNPTSFKVLVFDSAGARVDCDVFWMARGIV